jgi:GTPase Era involved in 16S rRNA processing
MFDSVPEVKMGRRSPRELKRDLSAACSRIELLIGVLEANANESQWNLGTECKAASDHLRQLLLWNRIPPDYKVAVIGRFKAGKSAFVNELLERRLAGEDTSPETAAITSFRSGENVTAKINFIDKVAWNELIQIHAEDSTDPAAHRIVNWMRFATKKHEEKSAFSNQSESFDLSQLQRDHVKDGGHSIVIELIASTAMDQRRKHEANFRKQIKQYTSSTQPHHCLVESIEIVTPSKMLEEGVTLLDTPGLDDTERFRVQLTERAVQDVDAVLFLTKSGAAYGQSEKDFLLSLLRKGTVKQLIFVVTQVDQTYDQYVRQAHDDGEDPVPIFDRIEMERTRLKKEINATLDELEAASGTASVQRYREQLGAAEIAFTSAANHRDATKKTEVRFPLSAADPGGMNAVKQSLFTVLATESRIAAAKQSIQTECDAILQQMLSIIESRRSAVRSLKDREVAESRLATFRDQFEEGRKTFAGVITADRDVLRSGLSNMLPMEKLAADNVSLQAQAVLGSYEVDDAGRHWKTRRGGNWGYMEYLQAKVANKIFPTVADQLNAKTAEFGKFIEKFRTHLKTLSDAADEIKRQLQIGDEFSLNMATELHTFLEKTLSALQELIAGEEQKIVVLLENFVDETVEDRISAARRKVAGILGRGTTANQTAEVRGFYKEVKGILSVALKDHVLHRFGEFSAYLQEHAEALPDRALAQVNAEIERASADIRAAAKAAIAGQKEAFEKLAKALTADINEASKVLATLFDWQADNSSAPAHLEEPPIALKPALAPPKAQGLTSKQQPLKSDPDEIRAAARVCLARFTLRNNSTRWPFSRIFTPEYVMGATRLWLIDPFLATPHQQRNFREFVSTVASSAKLKAISVLTKSPDAAAAARVSNFYKTFDQGLYEQVGTRLSVSYADDIHDRFAIFDSGIVFKLGRGLDIYKPVTGLASTNPEIRKVHNSEIDVFGPIADS